MTGKPQLHLTAMLKTAGMPTLTKMMPERRRRTERQKTLPRTSPRKNPLTTKLLQPPRPQRHSERERLPSAAKRLTRPPWLLDPRTTCDHPFAVFSVMSIPERPSSLTRSDRPTSRRAKPVVSLSRLVLHTSHPKPLSRKQLLSTKTASSSSRFPVFLSSIPLVTSLSLTSDLVVHRFVTLPFWSSISCTVLSPRPSSPCAC